MVDVAERHIMVQWNEGEGDFDAYVITIEPNDAHLISPRRIPRGDERRLRFDGLTPGQQYTFRLSLYKGNTLKAGPVIEIERTSKLDLIQLNMGIMCTMAALGEEVIKFYLMINIIHL